MLAQSEANAFRYPAEPLERRHGPDGYIDYQSYRPWLRDEFSFRCIFWLIREQWGRVTAEFDLDHFVPQRSRPDRSVEYDNLLYACHTCNLRKDDQRLPDPEAALTANQVRVYPDGTLVGLTDAYIGRC